MSKSSRAYLCIPLKGHFGFFHLKLNICNSFKISMPGKISESGNRLIRFGYINEKDVYAVYMWLKDVAIVQNK